MADEQFQEKTEKATPRRKLKAREEGKVCKSQELNSAVMLCLGAATLYLMGPTLGDQLKELMTFIFSQAPLMNRSNESIMVFFSQRVINFFVLMAPIFAILMIIAYGINLLQVGFLFTTKTLEPKLDKLDITKGIKKLVSVRSLVSLVRDVIKISLIAYVGYKSISAELDTFYNLADNSVAVFAGTMGKIALTTVLELGAIILILALFDYAYQKYDFEKGIKMSKQDIKDEMKDTEGSPQVKSRIRQIQREMSRKRMMEEIPKADVVVTNPTRIAVALKYDTGAMDAPMVVAKGERIIAAKIKEIAKAAGVPIVENRPLARALFSMCDIGSYVPAKLYRAVAEVLAYVYRQKGIEVE